MWCHPRAITFHFQKFFHEISPFLRILRLFLGLFYTQTVCYHAVIGYLSAHTASCNTYSTDLILYRMREKDHLGFICAVAERVNSARERSPSGGRRTLASPGGGRASIGGERAAFVLAALDGCKRA
jgi:hypothetical protein